MDQSVKLSAQGKAGAAPCLWIANKYRAAGKLKIHGVLGRLKRTNNTSLLCGDRLPSKTPVASAKDYIFL